MFTNSLILKTQTISACLWWALRLPSLEIRDWYVQPLYYRIQLKIHNAGVKFLLIEYACTCSFGITPHLFMSGIHDLIEGILVWELQINKFIKRILHLFIILRQWSFFGNFHQVIIALHKIRRWQIQDGEWIQ